MFLLMLLSAALANPCAEHRDGQVFPEGALLFKTATAELLHAELAIASVVCALNADPKLTIQVETHTDSRGAGSYNLRISQARAESIRDALIADGIDASRLTAVGFGETMPLGTNSTMVGRDKNRRIELHTEPPQSRPKPPAPTTIEPPPAPAPVPAPPEKPKIDPWCAELAIAIVNKSDAVWLRKGELGEVAQRMSRCLGESWTRAWDGDALYATQAQWRLSVEAGEEAVSVRLVQW